MYVEIRGRRFGKSKRLLELEAALKTSRDAKVAETRRANDLSFDLGEVRRQLTDALDRGGDPAARRLVGTLMRKSPFDRNCGIGPGDVCIVHFNERHCTVAWLKNWAAGLTATDGIVPLANVMTNRPTAPAILAEALTKWADDTEAKLALPMTRSSIGDDEVGTRSNVRLARAMAHAISAEGI